MESLLQMLSQNRPSLQTRKALILTGLQKDFLHPDGKLPVSFDSEWYDRLENLVKAFRTYGDVIWVRAEIDTTQDSPQLEKDEGNVIISLDEPAEWDDDEGEDEDENYEGEASEDGLPNHEPEGDSAAHLGKREVPSDFLPNAAHPERLSPAHSDHGLADPPPEPQSTTEPDEELFFTCTKTREPCCIKGTPGAEFASRIESLVEPRDMKIVKSHYSAFTSTSLLLTLRSRLITELFVCGVSTNVSVYATALDAARHGIKVTLIEDCLGYRVAARHELALRRLVRVMEAKVKTSTDALGILADPSLEEDEEDDYDDEYESDFVDQEEETKHPAVVTRAVDRSRIVDGPRIDDILRPNDLPRSAACLLEVDSDDEEDTMQMPSGARPLTYFRTQPKAQPGASRPTTRSSTHSTKIPSVKDQEKPHPDSNKTSANVPEITKDLDAQTLHVVAQSQNEAGPTGEHKKIIPSSGQSLTSDAWLQDLMKRDTPTDLPQRPKTRAVAAIAKCVPGLDAKTIEQFESGASPVVPSSVENVRTPRQEALFGLDKEEDSAGSQIAFDLLPQELVDGIFDKLQNEITWERMFHQTGEVPRLVCCQGTIGGDGSMPVYRHPSDQTMPISTWSDTVKVIREAAEKVVGHHLNHALIQLYRTGNDFISEHSDKTLDIVTGSNIVNVSFGAERTMRLRTKRAADMTGNKTRTTHRVRMPHNSMIIMSLPTNAEYLHGINADKRRQVELSDEEKAFDGQRISLTFRNIGTFLSADSKTIWGQGATSKEKENARPTINGDREESEKLVRAFGSENQSSKVDWHAFYGAGSDVLHLK